MNDMVSVIVPVYNVCDFLEKCVKSIISQTYREIEILLIDDGSTDGSSEICDNFMKYDQRVFVKHINNSGVSNARNIGIELARGKYIVFVDSDDYIKVNLIEKLVAAADKNKTELVCCGIEQIELDGKIRKFYGTKKEKIYRQEDIILGFFDRPHIKDYMYGPFNKLFLRELLGNFRFNTSLRMGEDFLFVFQYLSCCRTICILDECLYVYVKRPNSAMTATFNDKRMDYIKSVEIIESICKECYPYVLKKALAWGYVHRFNTCNQLDKYPELRQRYQVQYNKMRKYLKINKCLKASLSVKTKVKIWIKSISDKKFHL